MPVARSTLNLQYERVVVDETLLLHTDTMKQLTIYRSSETLKLGDRRHMGKQCLAETLLDLVKGTALQWSGQQGHQNTKKATTSTDLQILTVPLIPVMIRF